MTPKIPSIRTPRTGRLMWIYSHSHPRHNTHRRILELRTQCASDITQDSFEMVPVMLQSATLVVMQSYFKQPPNSWPDIVLILTLRHCCLMLSTPAALLYSIDSPRNVFSPSFNVDINFKERHAVRISSTRVQSPAPVLRYSPPYRDNCPLWSGRIQVR